MGSAGRYRTKIELLRDLVEAATREERKTRLIGMANLNRQSFGRYRDLGVSLGLLKRTPLGYRATPAAKQWLASLDGILSKGSELSQLMRSLYRPEQSANSAPAARARTASADRVRRLVAQIAWTDLQTSGAIAVAAPLPAPGLGTRGGYPEPIGGSRGPGASGRPGSVGSR